ncbi:hypothetical protein [Butyricimonas synergistica]|uniref:hypothetical protein n=1 Tax=Butyricimonas synergistica TaxID=544644 RepID=UPI00036EFEA9|nr:hypothetical protein [Butyricimonas synergistica]
MNKIAIAGLVLMCVCASSCAKDDELGEVQSLTTDYILPQGKSADDDRVVKLFQKYGSYFLYDFTERDFEWTFVNNSTLRGTYLYTLGDPNYLGDMLDMLEDIWFKFYPDEFLKKAIPYRVFLTSTLEWTVWGDPDPEYCRAGNNQIAISYCSDTLRKMSGDTKQEFMERLQNQLWSSWQNLGIVTIPDAFYEVSDYSFAADPYDSSSPNYVRARGFFGDNKYGYEWSEYISDWSILEYLKSDDVTYFIQNMLQRTADDLREELNTYPLLKKKYDILRNHFKESYGFDIQEIGNTKYN